MSYHANAEWILARELTTGDVAGLAAALSPGRSVPITFVGTKGLRASYVAAGDDLRAALDAAFRIAHNATPDGAELVAVDVYHESLSEQRADIPDLVGVAGVAEILGVSPQAAAERVKQSDFPDGRRVDKRMVYPRGAVEMYKLRHVPKPAGRPKGSAKG